MPEVFRSGSRIPELKGSVRRGLAVLVHSPTEVVALHQMIAALQGLPGDPITNAYNFLSGPDVNLSEWTRSQQIPATPITYPHYMENPASPASSLIAALFAAQDIWRAQEGEVQELAQILALPRPRRRQNPRRVVVESGRPALVLDASSVRAKLVDADVRPRNFGVLLFPLGRSRRQANLMEALRSRGAHAGAKQALPRLEAVSEAQLRGKSIVIVFLHGLMSTDLGTFDGLLQRLRNHPLLKQALLLGWPHDSLIKINQNATQLAELVERKFGKGGANVGFVCHSRGGLVARATAVQLFGLSSRWNDRLCGCVTFGTPHEGAELAEIGDQLLEKLLLLKTMSGGGRAVPLIDALWTIHQRRRLPGITDLKPRGYGADF